MSETEQPGQRRRRRRAQRPSGPPEQLAAAAEQLAEDPASGAAGDRAGQRTRRDRQGGKDPDRAWRELLGNAPSQVGVSGALRARDVARPGEAELAAADRDLFLVRRQWKPPEP
jgi:hypothetical protein